MRGRNSRLQKFDYVQRDGTEGTRDTSDTRDTSTSRSAVENKSLKPFRRQRGRSNTLSSTNYWSETTERTGTETATSLTNLREKCKLLVKYAQMDRMKLQKDHPEIFKEFMDIVYLGKAIVSKPEEYKAYMEVIGEVFGDQDIKERGTIGDFMYGCYKEQAGSGRKGCSPECAGSLPRHNSKHGDICDQHVGIYKNKLALTYSPEAGTSNLINIHAYKNKIKLTHETLEDLSDRGVKFFKIYWQTANPGTPVDEATVQTYSVKKMQSNVGNGGHISYRSDGSERFHRSRDPPVTKEVPYQKIINCGWNFGIIVIFIIFIIFIIIFGLFYCFSNTTSKQTSLRKEVHPLPTSESKYNKCI
jgi:hypothetical protein